VETFRKLWVNFLYIRGFRSDDGFSWKVAVILYLLVEFWATGLLQPRVYKRFKDAMVEVGQPWATRLFRRPHHIPSVVLYAKYDEGRRNHGTARG
jgi:hypothetical protein